jgi:methionine--tRNA ligase beta chain
LLKTAALRANAKRKTEERDDEDRSSGVVAFNVLDVRVGVISKAHRHPISDKLMCEDIHLGESSEPRQIISGIQKFYSPEDLVGKRVCVVVNLKPVTLGGEKSLGMVLCASWNDGQQDFVRLVSPPLEAKTGERLFAQGEVIRDACNPTIIKKRKLLEAIAEKLCLDDKGMFVEYAGNRIGISGSESPELICSVESGFPKAKVF